MGPNAAQLLRIIEAYRLAERIPQMAQLKRMLERNKVSEDLARVYIVGLEETLEWFENFPVLLKRPPTSDLLFANGQADIEFLTLVEGQEQLRYGLRLIDRPRHTLCIGGTGSGKTCSIRSIIFNVNKLNRRRDQKISVIVFDRKGGDYSDLPATFGPDWMHLSVHDGMRLGLNSPGGAVPNVWINLISSVFCPRAGLISAWVSFANILRWLVRVLNPKPTGQLLWPDLRLILDVCHASPATVWASKGEYLRSLITPLEGATRSSGQLLETFSGLDVERDIVRQGRSAVIDMANLAPPWLRLFVVDLIVAQLLFGRIDRHARTDTTDVLIVLDEADPDVSRESEAVFPDRMSVLGQLLKQGREFGLACCLGMTTLGNASRFVLSNAQYHLVFSLDDDKSVLEARRTLMLPPGAEQQLPALQPGECLFRESQGAWPHALWAKIDHMSPCRSRRPESFDTHPFIPSKRLHELPNVQEALDKLIGQHNRTKRRQSKMSMPANARRLLQQAAREPFTPVARLWEQLGRPSHTTQASVKRRLEGAELAKFDEVRAGRRNVLLIELTDKGWMTVDGKPPKRKGRGGIVHTHICQWLCMLGVKRGYEAKIEWVIPGTTHPLDCAWFHDGLVEGFEAVVECIDNVCSHARACFIESTAIKTLTIVAPRKAILQQVDDRIRADHALASFLDRIRFEAVEIFLLKELWP